MSTVEHETPCIPGHLDYPSARVAQNAVALHLMAYPHCEGYNAWACGDHHHVGHTSPARGDRCKAHPEHRESRKRIRNATLRTRKP